MGRLEVCHQLLFCRGVTSLTLRSAPSVLAYSGVHGEKGGWFNTLDVFLKVPDKHLTLRYVNSYPHGDTAARNKDGNG